MSLPCHQIEDLLYVYPLLYLINTYNFLTEPGDNKKNNKNKPIVEFTLPKQPAVSWQLLQLFVYQKKKKKKNERLPYRKGSFAFGILFF